MESLLQGNVYIVGNGEGYGHSSRMLAVAKYLDPAKTLLGCYGGPLERIKKAGFQTIEVTPEIKFFGKDGSFQISETILKNTGLPFQMNAIIEEEKKILLKNKITCVVSDCRSAVVMAAKRLSIPCIYMTNQTEVEHFFHPHEYREENCVRKLKCVTDHQLRHVIENGKSLPEALLSGSVDGPMQLAARRVFRYVDEIIVADFPAPYTVVLPILSEDKRIKSLQRLSGPLSMWRADDVTPVERVAGRPYVVGTFGGHKYREPLFRALVKAAAHLPEVQFDIISSFPCTDAPANVRLLSFVDHPESYYKAADVVVTQAGHSTIMELLTLGTPSIIVPDHGQIEQEFNAQRMLELGCSSRILYPELSAHRLAANIRQQLATPQYKESAQRMSQLAAELDGARKVAGIIREYSSRLIAY